MKASTWNTSALVTLVLTGVLPADVIYSNLKNSAIATNLTGLFVDVNGDSNWDINPFFGGVGVANTDLFQPVRTGTGNLDPLSNFSVGDTIDVSDLFSTGYGGSQTHLGTTFTADQEGYLGFKQNGNYGWMRVVFTSNTSGAVVKDWAYESSGAAISVGRIQQSTAVASAQTVTLSPAIGESFTLGSQITDTSGNVNSVLKTGGGSTVLTGDNTYSGTTGVSQGKLLVNGTISGSGTVSVDADATVGGTGSIAGALNVSGVLSPGASVASSFSSGALTMTKGSSFVYEASGNGTSGADLMTVSGALSLTGVTLDLGAANLGLNIWDVGNKLTLISYTGTGITSGFTGYNDDTTYTFGANQWLLDYNDTAKGDNFVSDATGSQFVTLTVVPEPAAALLGGLGLLALLRRRR